MQNADSRFDYIETLRGNLSEVDTKILKNIYEPKVVCVQPGDSRRDICVMPDGELRIYGHADKLKVTDEGNKVYLSSKDCGLSWKLHYPKSNSVMGSCVRSPWSDRYLTIVNREDGADKGTYALLSDIGPDDESPTQIKLSDSVYFDIFQPVALAQKKRWICTMHRIIGNNYRPVVMISDDDGDSWRVVELNSAPRHTVVYPHRGVRWENNGAEPTVVELSDGRLMLLARTSQDYFYAYYSNDCGETWTQGEPSIFHGTLTTPFLLRLSDGRILLFWNNTQPLPELDHTKQWPPLNEGTIKGYGEDVFTNRDASHAALTEDGQNWLGFRELFLNEIRNTSDFRVRGGSASSRDKSVHQFQGIELPYNKILVSLGQHEISRRTLIFDVNWLYEKTRTEDFQLGLKNLSTHVYVNSISGGMRDDFGGHCAWNRTDGALLVPDPDGTYGEALHLTRIRDPRLFSEAQGAVWNFPAAQKGELTAQMRVSGEGLRFSLTDRWFNPIDTTIRDFALFTFELSTDSVPPDVWVVVKVLFNVSSGSAEVFADDRHLYQVKMRHTSPGGISYLHLQSLANAQDHRGSYIRKLNYSSR